MSLVAIVRCDLCPKEERVQMRPKFVHQGKAVPEGWVVFGREPGFDDVHLCPECQAKPIRELIEARSKLLGQVVNAQKQLCDAPMAENCCERPSL